MAELRRSSPTPPASIGAQARAELNVLLQDQDISPEAMASLVALLAEARLADTVIVRLDPEAMSILSDRH